MEEARKLAFDGVARKKVVALDGSLFSKSGVISGGARLGYEYLISVIIEIKLIEVPNKQFSIL